MSLTMSKVSVPAFVRGLAEDMLPLSAQVQRASDTSKFALQRLSGGEAPKFEDNESSFAQLQERIAGTIAYLESVDAAQVDAGADREVSLKFGSFGANFSGESYLLTFALPNFYFHIVTAYDILRKQGVKIGKLDYLGAFGTATSA